MFRRSTTQTDTATENTVATADAEIPTVLDSTFHDDTTSGDVAIIDFWASWCGPCRVFAPIYHDVAGRRSREGLRFGSCDVDANPKTAGLLGIQSIPTLVAFDRAGNELGRMSGVPSERDLDAFIDKVEAAR